MKVLFLFLLFSLYPWPKNGDYICWTNSIKDPECGTYAFSKSKSVAIKMAMDLCKDHCNDDCELSYCEIAWTKKRK